jgi:hypothetical protein
MLLAPWLDRSNVRWLVRGVVVVFLGPLLLYYFHDRGASWLETAVVGQRLAQVALPLWVVSYAGVIDDWVAGPLRRRMGPSARALAVALGCLGLTAGTGLMFAKHGRHLDQLRLARDELLARVPADAPVYCSGSLFKIVGTPGVVPYYWIRPIDSSGVLKEPLGVLERRLACERRPWFLVALKRTADEPVAGYVTELAARHRLDPVPVGSPLLEIYAAKARPDGAPR